MPAGDSETPLARKLGIKDGTVILTIDAPETYVDLLQPLHSSFVFETAVNHGVDIVHLFVNRRDEMRNKLELLLQSLRADAAIWVSWPKKSSIVSTDNTEATIRKFALPLEFVDIKVRA